MNDSRNFIPMFNQNDVNLKRTMDLALQSQQRMTHYANNLQRPLSMSEENSINNPICNPLNDSNIRMMDVEVTRNKLQRDSQIFKPLNDHIKRW